MKNAGYILFVTFIAFGLISLFFEGNCKDDLKFSWYLQGKLKGPAFKFTNNGKEFIRITHTRFNDDEGSTITEDKVKGYWRAHKNGPKGFFVGPGETKTLGLISGYTRYAKTAGYMCEYQKPWNKTFSDSVGDLFSSAGDVVDNINPINYVTKRSKCQDRADRADTVSMGKRWYKECMDE